MSEEKRSVGAGWFRYARKVPDGVIDHFLNKSDCSCCSTVSSPFDVVPTTLV